MQRLEPSAHVEARIVARPEEQFGHQEYWPTVEVVETATVAVREGCVVRAVTYELVAVRPIDIREGGLSAAAVADAQRRARDQIAALRRDLYAANPDPITPARY